MASANFTMGNVHVVGQGGDQATDHPFDGVLGHVWQGQTVGYSPDD
jgi:hypothetical protein